VLSCALSKSLADSGGGKKSRVRGIPGQNSDRIFGPYSPSLVEKFQNFHTVRISFILSFGHHHIGFRMLRFFTRFFGRNKRTAGTYFWV
jgi:hypothetical protein